MVIGGADTLVFNGSNDPEVMSLSASGSSSVFLRDRGNIRMDMTGVEVLDLAALGGADSITIDDMSRTAVPPGQNIDLSALGVGDGQPDVVTVNGTESKDRVRVQAYGTTGRCPRAAHRDPPHRRRAADRLQVDGQDGDSKVHVKAAARALIDVAVDLGSDQRWETHNHNNPLNRRSTNVPSTETMPAITHVAVTVTDLEASEAWYNRVFGVKPVLSEDTGPFHHIVYELGGTLFGLHGFPELTARALRRTPARPRPRLVRRRQRHELVAWAARLDELGVPHGSIVDAPYGSGLSFRDPDNIALELFAPPGPDAHTRPGTARAVPHRPRSAIATLGDDDCPEGTSATMRTANEIAVASAVLVLAPGAAAG